MIRIGSGTHRVALLCIAGLALACANTRAQPYPNKPVHIVVGFSAAGSTDAIARLLAKRMGEQLGQPVIVDNRPGAGGEIALQQVAKSPPDGYTLLILTASSTTLPLLRKVPFDVERDFAPVSLVGIGPQVLVVNLEVPARDVGELMVLARTTPGKLTYGSSGTGTPSHLAGVLMDQIAKVSTTHVPYKGSSENIIGTSAGDVTMSFSDAISAMTALQGGKVKLLAVTTAKRASFMPTVPTFDESGMGGLEVPLWFGVTAPAGTPKEIIARLNATIGKALSGADTKEPMNKLGVDPQVSSPESFKAFVGNEMQKNARLIKLAGMKID